MMLFSMVSKAQKLDKEILLALYDIIELLVKRGKPHHFDLAERLGDWCNDLEVKIKTYDYSIIDQALERTL